MGLHPFHFVKMELQTGGAIIKLHGHQSHWREVPADSQPWNGPFSLQWKDL